MTGCMWSANFGALTDGLYEQEVGQQDSGTSQWNGIVDEFRQPVVTKSKYQSRLELEAETKDLDDEDEDEATGVSEIRFWSDYSRVFYHPRTSQRLPDVADYEHADGDWVSGRDAFTKYNEETELMEDSFRFFVEECDNPQGLQVINDTASFGSFTHSFLSAFRDDFTKLPCWTFSLLSDSVPGSLNVDEPRGIAKAVNDALCLQSLNELSTLNVPIQSPLAWESGPWLEDITLKRDAPYHTSSVLATHIESITLPFRVGAPAIPVPTSFPRYFTSGPTPSTLSSFATLSTTTRTAILFTQYAKFMDECTKQYAHVVQQMGLEMDDVKDLRDTLRALEDEYRGDDHTFDSDDNDEGLGEDE
ncbi:hypothetical protein EUX98_g8295 [Antrodiella citrinella]|uniref:DML1/Misato tubulin domain-containing protein n=1 Tax=Antrodiella citrinella TaxID=2447956 RepID=A0A4S4M8L0_9APHY|nr:hypothetical protein EUX98_g8295 [Antrodiella citrinella]